MKYLFIAQHKKTWPVDLMCQLLGVTRSGYYGYQRRGGDRIDYYHQELLEAVRDIAKATEDSYGSRRMKKALNVLSYPVSRNKVYECLGQHADRRTEAGHAGVVRNGYLPEREFQRL